MSIYLDDGDIQLHHGSAIDVLKSLPAGIAQTCVTSPPYWGLRSYLPGGHYDKATELGLEATPTLYVERLVEVFREVWRVLRPDATLWLNLGDSYLPEKQLAGMPWRVAFALQEAGWCLRSEIIWAKCMPNPMPESVTDRPTKSHEYLFLFSKQPRYFYDADAIREPHEAIRENGRLTRTQASPDDDRGRERRFPDTAGRNRRSVWTIPTEPFPEAHFATYPQALVAPCIQAGSSERGGCSECGAPWQRQVERIGAVKNTDYERESRSAMQGGGMASTTLNGRPPHVETTGWVPSCACIGDEALDDSAHRPQLVLDPFIGSGTTALVARKHGRRCIGIDLSTEYLAIAAKRTQQLSLLA